MSSAPPEAHGAPGPTPDRGGHWAGVVLGLGLGLVVGWLVARSGPSPPPSVLGPVGVPPADSSPILATINGEPLSLAQFEVRWNELLTPRARQLHRQRGGPEHYLDEVVEEVLLAQESRRLGLEELAIVREAARSQVNHALSRRLLASEVRGKAIPDSELRAFYEAHRDEWSRPARVRVREIVVTPEAEPSATAREDDAATPEAARAKAERLHRRALAGESFAELAGAHGESPTARYGGEIGWVVEGRHVEEYERAALGLSVGEISPVLETARGWVILRVEEREEGQVTPFEEVADEIRQRLLADDPGALARQYRLYVDELRRVAEIEIDEALLGRFEDRARAGAPSTDPPPGER